MDFLARFRKETVAGAHRRPKVGSKADSGRAQACSGSAQAAHPQFRLAHPRLRLKQQLLMSAD